MKIGCADGVCSHLNHVLTASSASDSACFEQLQIFFKKMKSDGSGIKAIHSVKAEKEAVPTDNPEYRRMEWQTIQKECEAEERLH